MTQLQIQKAEKLYDGGLNDAQIAKACGVTSETIRYWRGKTERPANYFSGEDKAGEWMVYLAKDDSLLAFGTASECAEALGMSRYAFYQMCHRARKGIIKKYSVYYKRRSELLAEDVGIS